jgi:hypothetical protein
MVRETHDGSLGDALGGLIGQAAIGAAAGALLLLALGLLAEVLRRRQRARRVLVLLDLTVPAGIRAAVVSLLALIAAFTGSHPAGADDGVRAWLNPTTTSTSARTSTTVTAPAPPPVVTPEALAEHVASTSTTTTTTAPRTGPVVLIPPLIVEHPGARAVTSPRTSPPAGSATPVAPIADARRAAAPVAALPTYVVQRDDCLWSIAARLLGARADARSIDLGWRQIYATNRAAIGEDPNLIHIGLTLELPPLVAQP